MAFPNITEFKEKLRDGGARPSLFRMEINWPSAIPEGNLFGSPNVPFQCRLAEIPGNNINLIPFKYAGREIKIAGQRTFTNLSVTIINDEGFKVRRALEAWFEKMNSRETNVSALTSPTGDGGYSGIGRVYQYNKTGQPVRSYVFMDLFPVVVDPIPLDWANDAAIEDYRVEFAYQYWTPGEEYAGEAIRRVFQPLD